MRTNNVATPPHSSTRKVMLGKRSHADIDENPFTSPSTPSSPAKAQRSHPYHNRLPPSPCQTLASSSSSFPTNVSQLPSEPGLSSLAEESSEDRTIPADITEATSDPVKAMIQPDLPTIMEHNSTLTAQPTSTTGRPKRTQRNRKWGIL